MLIVLTHEATIMEKGEKKIIRGLDLGSQTNTFATFATHTNSIVPTFTRCISGESCTSGFFVCHIDVKITKT